MSKPNCYKCDYRMNIPGDCHISCTNKEAKVKGNEVGKKKGWFSFPHNFDPVWLIKCDGFKQYDQFT